MNTSLAQQLFQEITVTTLAIVPKPAPVIAVGTVLHFKAFGMKADLPILKVIADPWKRDFETYMVENPMWTVDSQALPYMPIFSTSAWIQGYGAKTELSAKQWLLVAAMHAVEKAAMYKKLARRHKDMIFSMVTTEPLATSKGFGFHDELATDVLAGDTVKYARRMAKVREWQAVYGQLIAMYKALVLSGKV